MRNAYPPGTSPASNDTTQRPHAEPRYMMTRRDLPQGPQAGAQLFDVDGAAAISVKQIEGFAEVIHLHCIPGQSYQGMKNP